MITSFLGVIAQRTGLNLSMVSRYSYGKKGMALPMLLMALMTLGWFANIVGMVGDIWGGFIGNPSGIVVFDPASIGYAGIRPITLEIFLSCVVWGAVFRITAVVGIKAIEWVSTPVAPIIMIIAVVVGIGMLNEGGGWSVFVEKSNRLGGLGIGTGITAVVGSWIAGAVMGVDLFRFNKSVKAVWWCAAACFIFTNPLLNFVGYLGSVQVGQYNYVEWMMAFSAFMAVVGVFAWTVSLWTTDCSELYCNSLYTGPILDSFGIRANRKLIVVLCGAIGTILGALAVYQMFFANFINMLGSIAPPICAPLLADYFIVRREKYRMDLLDRHPNFRWAGIVSFLIGGALGFVFQYVWTLPLDLPSGLVAMLISFVTYIAIYRFTPDAAIDDALIGKSNANS